MTHDTKGPDGKTMSVSNEKELAEIADQAIELMVNYNLRLFEVKRTLEIIQETINRQFIRNRE